MAGSIGQVYVLLSRQQQQQQQQQIWSPRVEAPISRFEKANSSAESLRPSTKRRWSEFRRQAQRRKISGDMTERHYMTLIKQPCGYCGKRQGRIGVDRVCNDQHYTTANTIACCAICNFMKRDLRVRAFVYAAQAVTTGPMASHFPSLLGPVPCRASFLFATTKAPTCNRPASR